MLGFGCSVPAIMATRTLENQRDRLATMMVLPLMSCGARLTIWMLLVPAFFAQPWRAPVLWGIYMLGMVLALLLALLLKRTVLRGEEAPFVMELPPYRLPTARAAVTRMQQRSWLYLRKAGTVILAISILLWVLTSFPRPSEDELDRRLSAAPAASMIASLGPAAAPPAQPASASGTLEQHRAAERLKFSVAGRVGQALEPLLAPLGFDWKISTAMLGAFAAKEVFVAQMGIVYAMGEVDEESDGLRHALQRDYSPLTGVSLIIFLLIATPCMATLAITRRESGSWRWAALQVGGLTAVAYMLALVVYQLGRLVLG
jgi:ferrous iron transport protein B